MSTTIGKRLPAEIPAPLTFESGSASALRAALRRSARRGQVKALLLVAPLLVFLSVTFIVPIGFLLVRSVDNQEIASALPRTSSALAAWDGRDLPPPDAYAALAADLQGSPREQIADAARRLNFYQAGLRSLLSRTTRAAAEISRPDARERLLALDPAWGKHATWTVLKRGTRRLTDYYLLASVDLRRDEQGNLGRNEADALYLDVLWRTVGISLAVAALCLVIGYPVAYLLATTTPAWSSRLMMFVLLPFWTSLLVRTTAWLVLLQSNGVVNALLSWIGLVSRPLELVHNRVGVLIAMTHILLPFVILPVLAVMKGISPVYMRAASSLGAPFWRAFLRVYLPMTLPGVAAGTLLVFILALGYYITPTLVGGPRDQMLSTFIAYFVNQSTNWGMAAALSTVLLAIVLMLYVVLAIAFGSKRGGLR